MPVSSGVSFPSINAVLGFLLMACAPATRAESALQAPKVLDSALELRLYAEQPQIVTPVGIAIDVRGRPFVVESHTHSPPVNYDGPKHDRIKILIDRDGDGRCDDVQVFSDEPIEDMMNLAFGPDGVLYAVHQTGVTAFRDRDGDDRADEVRSILRTETVTAHDHSGLLGIAVSQDGWLYLSRGNVGGEPYTYHASGAATLFSYGDGGHIVRVRQDGTGLERIAAGFWNPFDIKFDGAGRLLAVDNDPDSRGPNRLLHVVPGGDYGYRARYGSSGLHPHSAWNGELPGTLPFIGGVGESPGGLLDANTSALPREYRDSVLVTVWAENSIELHRPRHEGTQGLRSTREILVKGDADFRPVGIAAAPDGTIFITDWVKKDYPNHGYGRVWTLRARSRAGRITPRSPDTPAVPDAQMRVIAELADLNQTPTPERLRLALRDDDPFVRAAATYRLARPDAQLKPARLLQDPDARVRLGAVAALRWAGGMAYPLVAPPVGVLARLLTDPDPDVRHMALLWTAESMVKVPPRLLRRALMPEPAAGQRFGLGSETAFEPLLRSYLATQALLTAAERKHLAARKPRSTVGDSIDARAALTVLRDRTLGPGIYAMTLPYLGVPAGRDQLRLVRGFLQRAAQRWQDPEEQRLGIEAIRTLAMTDVPMAWDDIVQVARDGKVPVLVRREAIAACASNTSCLSAHAAGLAALHTETDPGLLETLARGLRLVVSEPVVATALGRLADRPELPASLRDVLLFTLDPGSSLGSSDRPASREAWWRAVATQGDPVSGREVFFGPIAGCSRCHRVTGRGGVIGPDLSNIGLSVTRAQLLDAILDPSAQISPEYQSYIVEKKTGEILLGLQFHLRGNGASMRLLDGSEATFQLSEVTWRFSDTSLMPAGLEGTLAVSDMRALLAYLESRR